MSTNKSSAPRVIEITDGASIPDPRDKNIISAWSLAFIGTILCTAYLCVSDPDAYLEALKSLPGGVLVTFEVTACAILLSLPIGLLTGLGRLSRNRVINLIASTYVEVIRGIPLLVQLFYIYYGLGRLFKVPAIFAAVIAMSICYGAYMGEVFRSGIAAISKGQVEAARSLGFDRRQTMMLVVLPQAWRTILPPVGNEFIAMLKDTSLVSILAVGDILRKGREFASVTFMYFETYTMIALVYLFITLILSRCVSLMEAKLTYYDHK